VAVPSVWQKAVILGDRRLAFVFIAVGSYKMNMYVQLMCARIIHSASMYGPY
jgi:hypothetical protein